MNNVIKPLLIAGPCLIEGPEMAFAVAHKVRAVAQKHPVRTWFKGSFDKANRSAGDSERGPGLEAGLAILKEVRDSFELPVTTDVHETAQVEAVAEVCDILQIPAFLSRQTDLIVAAARSGRIVNIKKGQFMDAGAALLAREKALRAGASECWITERGTFFGYNDLVVDFRQILLLKAEGVPVVYDVTHSVQQPTSSGRTSGGTRTLAEPLARAAAAVGVDGFFFETHPQPEQALSDAALQIPLDQWPQTCDRLLPLLTGYAS